MLYGLARRALFTLDAETAHELTLESFRRAPRLATAPFAGCAVEDPFEWKGLRFRNRVGLAAGLDKNGECLEAWERLGFGFVEIGTVTPRPQPGNPRPRMFRLPRHEALINRLGFNNKGVDHLVTQVAGSRFRGVLGINIGKNADTPIEKAADDYLICLDKVYAAASYVTVNISSPNTKNLRDLQDEQRLGVLLSVLSERRKTLAQQHGRQVPLLVKIAPDVTSEQLRGIAVAVQQHGIDGLIATNTTLSRAGLENERLAQETGGLSGRPLLERATETLRALRRELGPDLLLIGVGGIVDAAGARAKREAGADLVQIYSGFIYRGPALVRACAEALRQAR
jgi:dihydroorotate dehydrogenase